MLDLRRAEALNTRDQFAAALLHRSEQKPDGPSSADTAHIVLTIGHCYERLNDFWAAVAHFRRAVAIVSFGFEGRICASQNVAKKFYNTGDYAEVEAQLRTSRSVIDTEASAGTIALALLKGHRAGVAALSANNLLSSGRFSEALPLYEECVAYYESIGDAHNLTDCQLASAIFIFIKDSPTRLLQWRRVHGH